MTYRFGLFEFDAASGRLMNGDDAVRLEPQPARALGALLAKPNEIVTKEEMRTAIWGEDHHVDVERGIAYCLSELRSALRDSASSPRYIQTLPRRGYRFIAPVAVIEAVAVKPSRRTVAVGSAACLAVAAGVWALARSQPARLAVSIFDNESGDASLDRWTASLADNVLVHLSTLEPARLRLIGNAAVLRRPRNIRNLDELARELDANFVLLGQLKEVDAGLGFVTHLIQLPSQVHLKANRLAGSRKDLAALERNVIGEFDRAIRVHVLKQPAKSFQRG